MEEKKGFIHSIESFSTVDGPGIRVVIFLQGCFLNCIYCHNPDTWAINSGKEVSAEKLIEQIEEYRGYIKNGGVTLSGGEPLLQPVFVEKFLALCKDRGFHTAIETAASVSLKNVEKVLNRTDLLILDLKGLNPLDCKKVCAIEVERVIRILNFFEENNRPVWVRHVIVLGITLDFKKLEEIAVFLGKYSVIECVELLPFHKMGEYKWKELNIPYTLENTRVPTEEEMEKCNQIFKSKGFNT